MTRSGVRERPGCRELVEALRTGEPMSWASARTARLGPATRRRCLPPTRSPLRWTLAGDCLRRRWPRPWPTSPGGGSSTSPAARGSTPPHASTPVPICGPPSWRGSRYAAARAFLADRGYADRVSVVAGDMFGELPALPESGTPMRLLLSAGVTRSRSRRRVGQAARPLPRWQAPSRS